MSAGIPVLEGFGMCSATQKQPRQYQENRSLDNTQHKSGGQNTPASCWTCNVRETQNRGNISGS